MIDMLVAVMNIATHSVGSHSMLLRVLRLLRMAKLGRVLRVKALKELRLIVQGLICGLRTIFWAFVFLFIFLLGLGIMTRQVISDPPEQKHCMTLPWSCTLSEAA